MREQAPFFLSMIIATAVIVLMSNNMNVAEMNMLAQVIVGLGVGAATALVVMKLMGF